MKAPLKKLLILALTSVFFVSAIVCCCFTSTVQAEESLPACHKAAQNQKASHDNQECECCNSKLQADYLSKISFHTIFLVIDFAPIELLLQSCFIAPSEAHLAYLNGPPGPTSDAPLYIHFHNFRI